MLNANKKFYIYKGIEVEVQYEKGYYIFYIDGDYEPMVYGKTKPHYEDIAKYLDDRGYTALYPKELDDFWIELNPETGNLMYVGD